MATAKQNTEFTSAVLTTYPLDDAIEWISSHMNPEEVFDEKALHKTPSAGL